ncbi:WbqC family protein [Verrucomicrobiota bacterium]
MKCAIHQPQFLPWLGYLHKIHNTDKFVFLDNVQFKKNEFQNRNRLLVAGSARWLTVPVSFHFGDTLLETRIAESVPWRKKITHAINLNYAKTPYFQHFKESLERVIEREYKNLAELNEATARWLMECFDIHTETYTSSQFPAYARAGLLPARELSQDPVQRLIDICRQVGADTYLSGAGGHKYLEPLKFEKAGIKLEFQEFQHPVYPQHHGSQLTVNSSQFTVHSSQSTEDKQFTEEGAGFVSCLSAIDGLFNCGGGAAGRKMLNIEIQ